MSLAYEEILEMEPIAARLFPPRPPRITAFVLSALAAVVLAISSSGCGGADGATPDAGYPPLEPYTCEPAALAAQADLCSLTWTGKISACSMAADGTPSPQGWLEVTSPAGERAYICADRWAPSDGYFFSNDREHTTAKPEDCCQTLAAVQTGPLPFDKSFGLLHGPTHVKPQETMSSSEGELRQNPFSIIVASSTDGQKYLDAVAQWNMWAGDGQPHPGPDGTGAYYFPMPLPVNYVVVPTSAGAPIIVIAPEVSMDPELKTPLGHPTQGACSVQGGSPLAFIAGDIQGNKVSNGSGRFGYELTVTKEALDNTKALFNCYGIPIDGVLFSPPEFH
jgi:hypothetical protein